LLIGHHLNINISSWRFVQSDVIGDRLGFREGGEVYVGFISWAAIYCCSCALMSGVSLGLIVLDVVGFALGLAILKVLP
jgi:hypothetical protein